ncbi:MAG: CpaF family protein [Acidimicrobiia bacterium]
MSVPAVVPGRETPSDSELKRRVHARLLTDAARDATSAGSTERDAPALRRALAELLRVEAPLLTATRHDLLLHQLVDEVTGLGPLQPLFADPAVTEVMVNGADRVYVERFGRVERVPVPLDADTALRLVERVIGPLGLRLDRSSPIVDARLPDGSRLHAVVPPLAVDGPCVTIRRFATDGVGLDAFGVTRTAAAFLRWAVVHGANVVVSGGTSAGKTTLCNALAGAMPPADRVVTIEETAELRLPLPHVVRLEARLPNAEGAGGVPVRALVRAALRMRPDRLIVGEVRGGEAFDLLQALNTGHDGSLTTVHANGVEAVVDRLTALVLMAGVGVPAEAAHLQIAEAIDYVVHVVRRDGRRRIQTIAEVTRREVGTGVVPLFEWSDGALAAVGVPSRRSRRPDAPVPDPRWFRC